MNNRRDEAGNRGNVNRNDRHLYRLRELDDYKVASNDPDVRGWTIVDRDNREFGTIAELVVDPGQEKVRYLDVVQKGDRARPEEEHLLIPVGVARIDDDSNRVIVKDMDASFLSSYPVHRGDEITRDYEVEVVERFNRPSGTTRERREGTDFYSNDVYNEDRFYTNRNRT